MFGRFGMHHSLFENRNPRIQPGPRRSAVRTQARPEEGAVLTRLAIVMLLAVAAFAFMRWLAG